MTTRQMQSLVLAAALALAGCTTSAIGPGSPITLERETVQARDDARLSTWKAVVTHTHNMRSGEIPFEEAKKKLVEWCRKLDIAAFGVGSPWEPASFAAYKRYEGRDRDLYYAGKVDPASVMHRTEIARLFQELNALSGGHTWFYLDNETPKNRLSHAWWFGFRYEAPAWHDYSQDRPIQYWEGDEVEINAITGEPHRRRCLLEIMGVQRKTGAIGIFAHPTSWWLKDGRFVTNIASELPLLLAIQGHLDGMVVMGYRAYHQPYQRLWFHVLDTGAVAHGFAETDVALDRRRTYKAESTYINYLHLPKKVDRHGILEAASRGLCFLSTGGFIQLSVDGTPMGSIAPTREGQRHRVRVEAYPRAGQSHFSRIELIGKGGTVLARKDKFPGGILEYSFAGRDEPHYLVARAFGQDDDPEGLAPASVRHLAITNPVYLHPPGFQLAPATTDYTFRVMPDSPWVGGRLEFQDIGGEILETHPLRPGAIRVSLPASARVELVKEGMAPRRFYIAMENPRVQKLLAYLYTGEFRKDFPGVSPGDVPPAAFRVAEMRDALRHCEYILK